MYQAFNMNNDYKRQVYCPYGCVRVLREEQIAIHITKCPRRDDDKFGHCKYNFFHIMLKDLLPYHEQLCECKIDLSENDFAYSAPEVKIWSGENDLDSMKYDSWYQKPVEKPQESLLKRFLRWVISIW